MLPAPSQSDVLTALRAFLGQILPAGASIFTGTISGTTLTVTAVKRGAIAAGDTVLGAFVTPGTYVAALGTGTGGIGTYVLSQSQAVSHPQQMTTGVEVVQGQPNRVPEPAGNDFVVMTPILRGRLSTNVDTYADVSFTASIDEEVMTVTAFAFGVIAVTQTVFGVGVAAGTVIAALGTGSGGIGTYTVRPSQAVASVKMASGGENLMQPTEVTVQLDVHGPNSADFAQVISTLFRDDFAVQRFAALIDGVAPLYTDEPKQIPFINGEKQWENRWIITAALQVNPVIRAPQQFADELEAELIDVDEVFPA